MRCSNCKNYIPEGLDFEKCPSCGISISGNSVSEEILIKNEDSNISLLSDLVLIKMREGLIPLPSNLTPEEVQNEFEKRKLFSNKILDLKTEPNFSKSEKADILLSSITNGERRMNYFRKHWHGKLSLGVSFWVNMVLLKGVLRIISIWINGSFSTLGYVVGARNLFFFNIVSLGIIYPWQIIGVWRACNQPINNDRGSWGSTVKVIIVLGLLGTVGTLNRVIPICKHMYKVGFENDKIYNYNLSLDKKGTLIHLQGGLGCGISQDVAKILKNNPSVRGIILDSQGGIAFEGRELSKLIIAYKLDTYTLSGCFSAATTAFVSGRRRYLATGANLGFHQAKPISKDLAEVLDIKNENSEDLKIFNQQGIKKEFTKRLFLTSPKDAWYPTIDELLDAGVVHELVNPSDLLPVKYSEDEEDQSGVEIEIQKFSVLSTLKKYDQATYNKIKADLEKKLKEGASQIELDQLMRTYFRQVVLNYLPYASDEALVRYNKANISLIKMLSQKDPFICLKYLYPEKYGPATMTDNFSIEEMQAIAKPVDEVLNYVIVEGHEKELQSIDSKAAEIAIKKIVLALGEYADYLDPKDLQNKEDYQKACDARIKFHEILSSENKKTCSNILRYLNNVGLESTTSGNSPTSFTSPKGYKIVLPNREWKILSKEDGFKLFGENSKAADVVVKKDDGNLAGMFATISLEGGTINEEQLKECAEGLKPIMLEGAHDIKEESSTNQVLLSGKKYIDGQEGFCLIIVKKLQAIIVTSYFVSLATEEAQLLADLNLFLNAIEEILPSKTGVFKEPKLLQTDKSTEHSEVSGNVYRNTKYHFLIKFPEGWKIEAGKGIYMVQEASNEDSEVGIMVQQFNWESGGSGGFSSIKDVSTSVECINGHIEGVKRESADVKLINYGETNINNEPAYWGEYSWSVQGLDRSLNATTLVYFLAKGNTIYTLMAVTATDKYPEKKPLFMQTISTFVLE